MEKIICICQVNNSTKADLIKAHLENEGIPCFLRTDNAGGSLPQLTPVTGIDIMIREEDRELAQRIIRQHQK